MTAVRIHDLTQARVLVTRSSARAIANVLGDAFDQGQQELELDFSGVDGITPSFLDEVLSIIQDKLEDEELHIIILNPPTRLSEKFAAIGRGRGLSLEELENRSWIITGRR